jgi:hypothetical protein
MVAWRGVARSADRWKARLWTARARHRRRAIQKINKTTKSGQVKGVAEKPPSPRTARALEDLEVEDAAVLHRLRD